MHFQLDCLIDFWLIREEETDKNEDVMLQLPRCVDRTCSLQLCCLGNQEGVEATLLPLPHKLPDCRGNRSRVAGCKRGQPG